MSLCPTCALGWVCEQHPTLAWPHEDCAGPGMPCTQSACPYWAESPGTRPLARTAAVIFDAVFASTDDEPDREH